MAISTRRNLRLGQRPEVTRNSTYTGSVSGSSIVINGVSFSTQLPARAACFQRDSVYPNRFRFELTTGDYCVAVDGGSPAVERVEIRTAGTMSLNTHYALSYALRVHNPGAKDAGSDGWILCGQLHQTEDGGDAGVSPLWARELGTTTRNITYARRTSQVDPIVASPSATYLWTDPSPSSTWAQWIQVVEHHRIDPTGGTGYHKVWHDGVSVVNYTGNTGYVDAVGPYWKFGLYRDIDASHTIVCEFDDFNLTGTLV